MSMCHFGLQIQHASPKGMQRLHAATMTRLKFFKLFSGKQRIILELSLGTGSLATPFFHPSGSLKGELDKNGDPDIPTCVLDV